MSQWIMFAGESQKPFLRISAGCKALGDKCLPVRGCVHVSPVPHVPKWAGRLCVSPAEDAQSETLGLHDRVLKTCSLTNSNGKPPRLHAGGLDYEEEGQLKDIAQHSGHRGKLSRK